ncbi:MAG: hypothetical protein WDZ62_00350 [Candidatus Pacearchaeota archaeon]
MVSKINSKHAFWQALIVTIAIFIIGLFLGISIEGKRAAEANERFIVSEMSLMDSFALGKIISISESAELDCETLIDANLNFADRIYSEAILFEEYGESEKLTENVKMVLKRYDLLRTLLWVNTMEISDECMEKTSVIVYLFDRDKEDTRVKSENKVWERILFELKQDEGEKIILIPIGVNEDLISLNTLISEYEISEYPVVIIDNEHVVDELVSINELKGYLK